MTQLREEEKRKRGRREGERKRRGRKEGEVKGESSSLLSFSLLPFSLSPLSFFPLYEGGRREREREDLTHSHERLLCHPTKEFSLLLIVPSHKHWNFLAVSEKERDGSTTTAKTNSTPLLSHTQYTMSKKNFYHACQKHYKSLKTQKLEAPENMSPLSKFPLHLNSQFF